MLDFYAKFLSMPTCSLMQVFVTSDQAVPDALVNSLVISGNESTINARFAELLAAGLDELMVSLVPTTGGSDEEQVLLMHLIGRL